MTYTKPKKKVDIDRPILYLDFETYVQGCKCDCKSLVIKSPTHPDLLFAIIVGDDDPHAPYDYVPRTHNNEEYEYFQTVNYCETQLQRESLEAFMFKDLTDTMKWLAHKENENAIMIAHCGGPVDFQFIFQDYFVNEDITSLKKTEAPLLNSRS